jgi:hypothetical protein
MPRSSRLVASFRLLPPDPPSSRGQLDVPGAITVTAGVALLVFAVARAGDTLRVTQPTLLAVAAVVLLGAFAARSEGTASGLLTATRQVGSALGVAILAATLVAVHGGTTHRTVVAMFVAAGFALAGLLATRVLPPGPPHPHSPQPHHLFRHHCGGIP